MLYILSIPFAGHELAEGIFLLGRSWQRGFSNGQEQQREVSAGKSCRISFFAGEVSEGICGSRENNSDKICRDY